MTPTWFLKLALRWCPLAVLPEGVRGVFAIEEDGEIVCYVLA
jgi:hypothetical protein